MSVTLTRADATGHLPVGDRIFIAGHRGMVGSALYRHLTSAGYRHLIVRKRSELDLLDQHAVRRFFADAKIDAVFLAAAKVGGIYANNIYPAEFIYQNLMIEANVIHSAFRSGVRRLLFLGSSCIYPKHARQPIKEAALLTGRLEATNEPYAIAKIAGIKLCESYNRQYGTDFRAVMPTNLYGPNDNFDLQSSHVLPALIRKFHLAKLASEGDWEGMARDESVFGPIPEDIRRGLNQPGSNTDKDIADAGNAIRLWGSGRPRREFLHVDDLASACCMVMGLNQDRYRAVTQCKAEGEDPVPAAVDTNPDAATVNVSHINVGVGSDVTILELAETVKTIVGYSGEVQWDRSKPDGTPRKLLDVSLLESIGWNPQIPLKDGIRATYRWYLDRSAA
jgi:GDP-L-fucose synthase